MDLHQNTNSVLKEQVEQSLSNKFGKIVEITSSRSIGGGCINHASKIDTNVGSFFLKWNANCPVDIFIREAESLSELKKATGSNLLIPEVFACKTVDSTHGFLVQEYFSPGFSFSSDAEKLGRGLAIIHQYKNESFGFYNNNYCGATLQNNNFTKNWVEFFRDKRLRFLLELIQKERPLPISEILLFSLRFNTSRLASGSKNIFFNASWACPEDYLLEKLLDRIPALLPDASEPVLIHGDLWSSNFMTSEKGPVLIDPASYYADREMEFAIITMFGGFSSRFFDAYNEANQLPADWQQRNKLYQLYHILNHYYLFGGGYRTQALNAAKLYL